MGQGFKGLESYYADLEDPVTFTELTPSAHSALFVSNTDDQDVRKKLAALNRRLVPVSIFPCVERDRQTRDTRKNYNILLLLQTVPDGDCLFSAVLAGVKHPATKVTPNVLRRQVAAYAALHWEVRIVSIRVKSFQFVSNRFSSCQIVSVRVKSFQFVSNRFISIRFTKFIHFVSFPDICTGVPVDRGKL